MNGEDPFEFEVRSRADAKTEFVVRFRNLSAALPALEALGRIAEAHKLQSSIMAMRTLCEAYDNRVFLPAAATNLPKARWASLAAAASFPSGVPIDLILERGGLSTSELSVYCTSKNNPTSKYLYIEDGLLFIRGEGIDWVLGLLKKDKQISSSTERGNE